MVLGKSSLHANCEGPLGIPLQSVPGPRPSSGVEAQTSGFLYSADMDLGVPLEFPQWSQSLSHGDMQVCFPLELEEQCQASCWVDIGIGGFLWWCHRGVTLAFVFSFDPWS